MSIKSQIPFQAKLAIYGVGAAIVASIALSSFYVVSAGERAIKFTVGNITNIDDDGLHFKIPFIQNYTRVDVRTQKTTAEATAGTKDLQNVTTSVTLNYHFDQTKLKETYTQFGLDLEQKVIDPRIQEIVKAICAKYSAEELIAKRELVKTEIEQNLRIALSSYNIIAEAIQITQFSFSKEYNAAIEAKQTSIQQALKAENDLRTIEIQAKQRVTQAGAEAEAIRIQTQAIREQGGEAYVKLKYIEKWDGEMPKTVLGNSTPIVNLN